MLTAVKKLVAEAGGCHGCDFRRESVWVIRLNSVEIRLCRTCMQELRRVTK
jgi:hypothetical protein